MPTYSYTCKKCHHEFDAFQKITDAPLTTCPQCNAKALEKGIGGGLASFQFKGKGFYITDYKNESSSGNTSNSCCPCGKNKGSCSDT